MFGINSWEVVIIVLVALLVIGPERLPEYVAKMRTRIRDLKRLAEGAKTQLRDQMGPEFDDVDWSAYDPRQYDPRRIVREALADAWEGDDKTPPDSRDSTTSTDSADSADSADRTGSTAMADANGSNGAGPQARSAGATPRLHTPDYTAVHDPSRPVPFDTDAT